MDALPIAVVLHRLAVLAVGDARPAVRRRPTPFVTAGLVCWAGVLAWPLFFAL